MTAYILTVQGEKRDVVPANGTDFSYEELKEIVGGYIDIQPLPKSGLAMVINDSGKIDGLEKNELATNLWKEEYPIAEYPHNNDELVVGNVLVCDRDLVK